MSKPKIIKRDKKVAEKEALDNKQLEIEDKARKEYFKERKGDALFQKYVVDEIINAELNRITNIEWMYSSEHLGESSNSRVGEIIRRNSIVYRSLKNILKPIIGD